MEVEPVQIISFDENNFSFKTDVLERILQQNDVKDKFVCVVSIVGTTRQGKSFLLNFLLRYLRQKYRSTSKCLQGDDGSLHGFPYQAGSTRHTTGILMWPEIFLAKPSAGDEIAIILLDCQGIAETAHQDLALAAVGTFLSSVLIYNLKEGIKQYDLSTLKCFAEHARRCLDQPHQKLIFLVRDWPYCNEYSYGEEGGLQFLQAELDTKGNQTEELLALKAFVSSCFEDVGCFLVPYPGKGVATDDSRSTLDKLDEEFKKYVELLVPTILSPDKLVPKVVNGEKITVGDLCKLLGRFQKELVEEKSTVQVEYKASASVQHIKAFNESVFAYEKLMSHIRNIKTDVLTEDEVFSEHEQAKMIALSNFRGKVKQGDRELSNEYEEKLEKELERKYQDYVSFNQIKYRNQQEEEQLEKMREEERKMAKQRNDLEEAIKELQEKGRELLKQEQLLFEQKEQGRAVQDEDGRPKEAKKRDEDKPDGRQKKSILYFLRPVAQQLAIFAIAWLSFKIIKASLQ